jgi:hypothetical protein
VSNRFRISSTLQRLNRRLCFPHDDLFTPPEFYDFVYRLIERLRVEKLPCKNKAAGMNCSGEGGCPHLASLSECFTIASLRRSS